MQVAGAGGDDVGAARGADERPRDGVRRRHLLGVGRRVTRRRRRAVNIVSTVPSTLGVSGSSTITWNGSANGAFSVRRGSSTCSEGTQLSYWHLFDLAEQHHLERERGGSCDRLEHDPRVSDRRQREHGLRDDDDHEGSEHAGRDDRLGGALDRQRGTGSSTLTWHASKNGTFSVRVGGASCATGTRSTRAPTRLRPWTGRRTWPQRRSSKARTPFASA